MDYFSLILPIAYLILLGGSLATFSSLYRRRQAQKALSLEPWFPVHLPRNIYLSLLELQAQPETKVPDTILRAALLRRAVEDIRRLIQLRTQKPALMQLHQRGSVGDDLWKRFQTAEKEMELELKDVVNEANALAPLPSGANPQTAWGNIIFQSASEMAHREMLHKKLAKIEEKRAEEKADWEARRKGISDKFLGEIGADPLANKPKEQPDPRTKNASSDEDTVLVEAEGPDTPAPAASSTPDPEAAGGVGGGGGKRKKKGKK